MRRLLIAMSLVTAALALGGCPAAHTGYPTQACKTDSDCYLGEKCMNNSVCITIPDDLATPIKSFDMAESRDADGGHS